MKPAARTDPPAGALRRELGLGDAVAVGLGAIIGAGIFVVSGLAADVAGPALLLSLLLAGSVAAANALSSAELAATYPQSGGTYEYGYRLLHPWAGFAAGWLFLASKTAAAGTVALGFGEYLSPWIGGLSPRALAVGAIVVFTILNYAGVSRTAGVNRVLVALTLAALLLYSALLLPSFSSARLEPFAPAGAGGVLRAAALLFFAYTGYARIATLGEEVHDARQTIPRAIEVTIASAIVLYLLVGIAALGAAGAPALGRTGAPLAEAARAAGSDVALVVVRAGAITALLGVILSQVLGMSRMVFAMARRGDLPRALGHVHAASAVPRRAVLAIGAISAAIAATGALADVAAAAAFAILLYYAIANVAALRLPPAQRLVPPWVPVYGLLGCLTLAATLPRTILLTGMLVLAAGAVVRLLLRPR